MTLPLLGLLVGSCSGVVKPGLGLLLGPFDLRLSVESSLPGEMSNSCRIVVVLVRLLVLVVGLLVFLVWLRCRLTGLPIWAAGLEVFGIGALLAEFARLLLRFDVVVLVVMVPGAAEACWCVIVLLFSIT